MEGRGARVLDRTQGSGGTKVATISALCSLRVELEGGGP